MSEFKNPCHANRKLHWHLMVGVSVVALLSAAAARDVYAEDAEKPTVWVELGGQLERVNDGLERFTPSFLGKFDSNAAASSIAVQRPPRYANGVEGALSFQPEDSPWAFSAAVRYGRSNNGRKAHQESPIQKIHGYVSIPALGKYGTVPGTAVAARYADIVSRHDESHLVLDFAAGRDVGVGLFGENGSSIFSAGVRFAQFTSKSTTTIGGDPDFKVSYKYLSAAPPPLPPFPGYFKLGYQDWHQYRASIDVTRNFHGLGPTISWNASALVAGNMESTRLTFDWGANASVLFGRQKAIGNHHTNAVQKHLDFGQTKPTVVSQYHSYDLDRTRSVTVPNVGGFAGVSVRFPDAKVSLGYRADYFFSAIDGGIDTRRNINLGFHGPFATISIGLGG